MGLYVSVSLCSGIQKLKVALQWRSSILEKARFSRRYPGLPPRWGWVGGGGGEGAQKVGGCETVDGAVD